MNFLHEAASPKRTDFIMSFLSPDCDALSLRRPLSRDPLPERQPAQSDPYTLTKTESALADVRAKSKPVGLR
jgi:hypothetical protein